MSPYGIRDPRTKVHKIRGISFDWPDLQRCQISSCSDKKCAGYPLWKNSVPQKSRPNYTRSPDLSPINRPYTNFYRHSVVTLALDCFISEISLVCIAKATSARTPWAPHLSPKIWRYSPRVRSIYDMI